MIDRYVSPEELRRLLAGLSGVIGVILIFGLFALIVVPGLRNANRPPTQTPLERVGEARDGWIPRSTRRSAATRSRPSTPRA